ncbi:hypothetical protein BH11PLA2_BH11PLA2_16960 [soil metagenome]
MLHSLSAIRLSPRTLALLGAGLVCGGMGVTAWWGVPFILLGFILLLRACRDDTDGVLVLGPIPWSELTRRARRQRPWLWRSLYVLAAGAILYFNLNLDQGGISAGTASDRKRLEYTNQRILNWFAVCLIGYVSLLTLQLCSTAIAEERLGRRWDVLRTTDLRPREMLLGFLFARLPTILDPLLAVAPVLGLLPLFGGVSPILIVSLVLICVSVPFGVGAVSLFSSLFAKKPGDAAGATIGIYFIYCVVTSVLLPNDYTVFQFDYFRWLGWANPFILGFEFQRNRLDIEYGIFVIAWHFSTAMAAFFFVFLFVGIRRLPSAEVWATVPAETPKDFVKTVFFNMRNVLRRGRGKKPVKATIPIKLAVDRPPVTDEPVVWWERYGWLNAGQAHFVQKLTPRRVQWIFGVMLGLCVLAYPVDMLIEAMTLDRYHWLRTGMKNFLLGVAGITAVFVAVGSFFPAPFRGAKCIVRERTADTLEPLLLTDLPTSEIIRQKWLGVTLCDLPLYKILIAIVLPTALTGLVPFVPVVLALIAVPFVVAFLAMFGVYISTLVKTAFRANVLAGFLMYLMIYPFGAIVIVVAKAQNIKPELAAPVGMPLWTLGGWMWDFRNEPNAKAITVLSWFLGLLLYAGLTRLLYSTACARFAKLRDQSR